MSGTLRAVQLERVAKRYGDAPPVLESLSLSAAPGEFVAVIGPSGCGKTTLLRLISGLAAPSAGTVTVLGGTPEAVRRRMAYIFQEATLLPWLTVEANLGAPLALAGVPAVHRRATAARLLALVGLADVAAAYPRQLSSGMRMRVSVARALAQAPDLLLLDEPFGALDEMTRNRLNEELLRLREERRWTAFFVTHSVQEAVFLSTRVMVMAPRPGRIHAEIAVPFPHPRPAALRQERAFLELAVEVQAALHSVAEGTAP